MQIRKFLKNYKGIDSRLSVNNRLIFRLKEDAMMFLGDSADHKEIREMCVTEAKKIKAESDQLIHDRDELISAIQKLSPLQHQMMDMYVIKGMKASECCDVLGCTMNQFYSMKEAAVQELERMLNEDEAHSNI